jgi:hypothetical protein
MPPPNTATMRAIEELAAISSPVPLVVAKKEPVLEDRAPAPQRGMRTAVIVLLMIAATAVGWFVRDLVAGIGL